MIRTYPVQCKHSDTGLCVDCFKFHEWMARFYDLIWAKYRPNHPNGGVPDGEGHSAFDDEQEKILHNIINKIDEEMGR